MYKIAHVSFKCTRTLTTASKRNVCGHHRKLEYGWYGGCVREREREIERLDIVTDVHGVPSSFDVHAVAH